MNLFDRVTLLATGLVAIYLIVRFVQDYLRKEPRPVYNIYYMISFTVLLVAGLLLIAFTYSALENPLVIVVSYLIPLGLALGLVTEFHERFSKLYLVYGLVGLIGITATKFGGVEGWDTVILAIFHSTAGLLIFFIPIFAVKSGKVPGGFIMVTVGGTLIGIGGIALAFLKAGAPILSAEVIFTILAPLLLLMALTFAWGFVKKIVSAAHAG
jgi:hypothetical protein